MNIKSHPSIAEGLVLKTEIVDGYGNEVEATMLDQLKVATQTRLCGRSFDGAALEAGWFTTASAANGAVTVASSEATITTTADSGSAIAFTTTALGRYISGNMNYARFTTRFGDTGAANNIRKIGICQVLPVADGHYFQLDGTTFGIASVKGGGAPSVVNSGAFNGNVSSWAVDTNYHVFEIYYTNGKVVFSIDSVKIHTIQTTTTTLTASRHLRPFVSNANTGVGSVLSLVTSSMLLSRYGPTATQPRNFFQVGTTAGVLLKSGPGALHRCIIANVTSGAILNIYDGLSTSGTLIFSTGTMTLGVQSADFPFDIDFNGTGGIQFSVGLFFAITTQACNALLMYE